MSYPTYAEPKGLTNVHAWVDWAEENGLWIPINSRLPHACSSCFGFVRDGPDGTPYWQCWDCRQHSGLLDAVVPASYSWHQGLEAAVYWSKTEAQYRWLNIALGCLLHRFLADHYSCIERDGGQIDVITMLPSHPDTRQGWDHMRAIYDGVSTWPQPWDADLLTKTRASTARERRGVIGADLFEVNANVAGAHVAVVDDLFTKGGTLRSAAAALKAVGAERVTAIALGRQVNADDPNSHPLRAEIVAEDADARRCAVHLNGDDDYLGFGQGD